MTHSVDPLWKEFSLNTEAMELDAESLPLCFFKCVRPEAAGGRTATYGKLLA